MSEENNSAANNATSTEESTSNTNAIHAKYKQLLNMARNSIESKQEEIEKKDRMIGSLKQQLDEMKTALSNNKNNNNQSEGINNPKNILKAVQDVNCIWVLIEYLNSSSLNITRNWVSFKNDLEIREYIQRCQLNNPGPPLVMPSKLLSTEESEAIEKECKAKVDTITEEFRKYKVRVEIARKQRDAEVQQQMYTLTHTEKPVKRSTMSVTTQPQSIQDLLSTSLASPLTAAADHMHTTCAECVEYKAEIEQLQHKIQQLSNNSCTSTPRALSLHGLENGSPRLNRRNSKSLTHQMDIGLTNDGLLSTAHNMNTNRLSDMIITPRSARTDDNETHIPEFMKKQTGDDVSDSNFNGEIKKKRHHRRHSINHSNASNSVVDTMEVSKNAYAKQMIYQYLTCKDIVVKQFIEDALCKLFRYNEQELKTIHDLKANDNDAIDTSNFSTAGSNIFTNLFGMRSS